MREMKLRGTVTFPGVAHPDSVIPNIQAQGTPLQSHAADHCTTLPLSFGNVTFFWTNCPSGLFVIIIKNKWNGVQYNVKIMFIQYESTLKEI